MLQSEVSCTSALVCFWQIITDIGDNQSIENHLSTYSYRLKNMKYFLRKCNQNPLPYRWIGTGLTWIRGALAEAFLDEFYNRRRSLPPTTPI